MDLKNYKQLTVPLERKDSHTQKYKRKRKCKHTSERCSSKAKHKTTLFADILLNFMFIRAHVSMGKKAQTIYHNIKGILRRSYDLI